MHRRSLLASLSLSLLAGCSLPGGSTDGTADDGTTASDGDTSSATGTTTSTTSPTATPSVSAYGLTTVRADGNRLASGQLDLRTASVANVPFPVPPAWVAGARVGDGSVWAVVLQDGSVHGVGVDGSSASAISLSPDSVDGPPLLAAGEQNRVVVRDSLAAHTAPVPVGDGLAWVRSDGKLRTPGGVVAVDALPDAMPVVHDGLVFVLAGPTNEYNHGVLGDSTEATRVAVVDAASGEQVRTLSPPTGVIEGRSVMVATLGGDPAVVLTASDSDGGARLVAIGVDDNWRATGPPVGSGFRWRHQLAVAPFASGDDQRIGAVRTPHIGGTAEFYRRSGSDLELVATDAGGYASHEIGSRNLGGGVAGRFVRDDQHVLLVPNGSRDQLVALHDADGSVKQSAGIPLDAKLTSNLAALAGSGGSAALAAGTEKGLTLWLGG
jgi:hypothetical protein